MSGATHPDWGLQAASRRPRPSQARRRSPLLPKSEGSPRKAEPTDLAAGGRAERLLRGFVHAGLGSRAGFHASKASRPAQETRAASRRPQPQGRERGHVPVPPAAVCWPLPSSPPSLIC